MMKIAIMTQPLGKNYGGIMQAWALQQVLQRMGHDPVTIDRQPDQSAGIYNVARLAYRAVMKTAGKRKSPINFERHLPTILQHTHSFIDNHIEMSVPLRSTKALRAYFDQSKFDAVIIGSDQTWRPNYSPNIYNYFLDFLQDKNIKRIAYASSFGVDEWEFTAEQTQRCSKLAKLFDVVSVREDSGIDLCRKHLGISAAAVLDPTLLLEKKDYEELIGSAMLGNLPKGVYTYFLDKTPIKEQFTVRVAKELGEVPYSCQPLFGINSVGTSDINHYMMPAVEEWLAGFANARMIVTDSFHGMVFSLIFNKPFIAITNGRRGMARFTSLANLVEAQANLLHEEQLHTMASFDINKIKVMPPEISRRKDSIQLLSSCLHE